MVQAGLYDGGLDGVEVVKAFEQISRPEAVEPELGVLWCVYLNSLAIFQVDDLDVVPSGADNDSVPSAEALRDPAREIEPLFYHEDGASSGCSVLLQHGVDVEIDGLLHFTVVVFAGLDVDQLPLVPAFGDFLQPSAELQFAQTMGQCALVGVAAGAGIRTLFGDQENTDWNKKDIDWNSIDSQLVSRHVLVTKPNLNGIKLGSLRLRNSYGINITRVNRAGIDLLASPSLRLQLGDKLTIVGETKAIDNVANILGNQEKQLKNPNLFAIFIGLAIGLIIGSIPFSIPGMSMPVRLGLAGGPIITGILMGAFGPRLHLSIYTTRSANLMLRQLGLIIYLAALGLSAGKDFFETVFRTEGLIWIAVSFALAVVPVLVVGYVATKWAKVDYAGNVGMLCGSMANPIALDYANTTVDGDEPSVAYATVYPFSIFLRVISIQIIMLLFC